MAHRNRWCTWGLPINSTVDLSMANCECHNQMVNPMYRWWKPIKSGQISAQKKRLRRLRLHPRMLGHGEAWAMSKADVGRKFPWNAMECWVSSQSFTNTPRSPRIQHWIQPNQEYSEWLTWTCMYKYIYIYGFSYGLQCPISFGDITNGRGNKQVSIDAGIWKIYVVLS